MESARETDLPDLLESLGYHVQKVGRYHTTKEMDSLRIKNRRTWFRYSENTGGDAITFLQRFCNKSFPEAVEFLLYYRGRARDSPVQPSQPIQTKEERIPFALPPANTNHRRVFTYLKKRGISPQVIRSFLDAGLLYEDAKYHNCVFVGRDVGGIPVFASRRGTYDLDGSSFKRDVPGSDKRVAFRLPSRPDLDWVLVFEAPIDLMSYLTLHRQVTSNAVALCGVYGGALESYLKDYPHIRQIGLGAFECISPEGEVSANFCAGQRVLSGPWPRMTTALSDIFGTCPAVAARITLDVDRSHAAVEYNPLWQKAHMEHGQIVRREKHPKSSCQER